VAAIRTNTSTSLEVQHCTYRSSDWSRCTSSQWPNANLPNDT